MSRIKPKAFWEAHVEGYHKSGLSQSNYCRAHHLRPRSLQYHLSKERRKMPGLPQVLEKCAEWLPMAVIDEPVAVNSGGVRLQICRITVDAHPACNPVHLANMLRTVSSLC